MAITELGTNTFPTVLQTSSAPYNYSWSHTLVAASGMSRRVIFVSIGGETGDSDLYPAWLATSVTYGGVAMAQVVKEVTTENGASLSNNSSELWILREADLPANGTHTVQVNGTTTDGASVWLFGLCAEYGKVDQSITATTDGTFVNSTSPSDTIANTVDPNNADLVISSYVSGNAGSWTVGQSQIELYDAQNPTGPTNTFGVCELLDAPPGPYDLESTYVSGANRLTRVAASLVAWRKINGVEVMTSVNGVTRHDMGTLNNVL